MGMGKGTKVVTHVGTGTNTSIFYKRGYENGYYNTLSIRYPLPSLTPPPYTGKGCFLCHIPRILEILLQYYRYNTDDIRLIM